MCSALKVALLVALSLSLLQPGEAAARCKLGKPTLTKKVSGACSVLQVKVKVNDRKCPVDVTAAELCCGALKLGGWKELASSAVQVCQASEEEGDSPPMEYYMGEAFTPISQVGDLVSVDAHSGGYTGGAHPYAAVKRRTFSRVTGKVVSLKDLLGRRSKALLARAKKQFERLNKEEGFAWDPLAFALKGSKALEFAFPHQIEVHAGETLKVTLKVKRNALKTK